MEKNILITTTPYVEGAKIIDYRGIIVANQVLGVNAISDAIASFSDFFGGKSGEYRNKMNELQTLVEKMIETEAIARGANAVVGFSLNISEVSGKGKQMFMATATGTAVKLDTVPVCDIQFEKNEVAKSIIAEKYGDFRIGMEVGYRYDLSLYTIRSFNIEKGKVVLENVNNGNRIEVPFSEIRTR